MHVRHQPHIEVNVQQNKEDRVKIVTLRHGWNTPQNQTWKGKLFDSKYSSQDIKTLRKVQNIFKYIYIQGVPGGMDKTSGECSLC